MSLPAKVLVANRGEIAVRIMRTLRRLGHRERRRLPRRGRRLARRARGRRGGRAARRLAGRRLPGRRNRSSRRARQTGAEALHPGFGFLSENADFAEAVADAGMTFIGPPPAAIRAMGDKIDRPSAWRTRRVCRPCPGSDGRGRQRRTRPSPRPIGSAIRSCSRPAPAAAARACGSRATPTTCATRSTRASGEAHASFGDGRVFVERYIERPRHIEVQVLADAHGNVVHLGERECSIQRRYQKVIEECPSPFVDEEMRAAMGATAVALARDGRLRLGGDGRDDRRRASASFYFLEMNTRLQVEHPVTELVTGIDIVAEQLRIAAGEPLALRPGRRRASTATRSSAASTPRTPTPASSRRPAALHLVRFPTGEGVRVDHGVDRGPPRSAPRSTR